MKNNVRWKQIILGLVFLVIAFLVLGELAKWLKTETIFGQYWPILLIFVGFLSMNPGNVGSNTFSFGVMGLGLLLLMRNYGFLANGGGEIALFIILVIAGIGIMAFAFSKPNQKKTRRKTAATSEQPTQYQKPNKFYMPKNQKPDNSKGDRMIDGSKF